MANKAGKLVLGLLLLCIGLVLSISGMSKIIGKEKDQPRLITEESAISQHEETETQKTFGVGEKVELNGIVTTLKSVTESEGSPYISPADGSIFVFCEFEIENNSSKDITVYLYSSFDGYCDSYATPCSYNAMVAMLSERNMKELDGTVASGKKMNGVIGFELPKDWKELEIRFKPNLWENKSIIFAAKNSNSSDEKSEESEPLSSVAVGETLNFIGKKF